MKSMWCVVCGCTQDTACHPPCHWISDSRCSACAGISIQRAIEQTEFEALSRFFRMALAKEGHKMASALRRALAMHLHGRRMTVRLESGEYVWRLTPAGREFMSKVKSAEAHEAKKQGAMT